jgi:hypothetical protein
LFNCWLATRLLGVRGALTAELGCICCKVDFMSTAGSTSPVQPTNVCDQEVSSEARCANESNSAEVPERDLSVCYPVSQYDLLE